MPQPFTSVPLPEEVSYLNDILVYDTLQLSWHGVRARGKPTTAGEAGSSTYDDGEGEGESAIPEGRYGKFALSHFARLCV